MCLDRTAATARCGPGLQWVSYVPLVLGSEYETLASVVNPYFPTGRDVEGLTLDPSPGDGCTCDRAAVDLLHLDPSDQVSLPGDHVCRPSAPGRYLDPVTLSS